MSWRLVLPPSLAFSRRNDINTMCVMKVFCLRTCSSLPHSSVALSSSLGGAGGGGRDACPSVTACRGSTWRGEKSGGGGVSGARELPLRLADSGRKQPVRGVLACTLRRTGGCAATVHYSYLLYEQPVHLSGKDYAPSQQLFSCRRKNQAWSVVSRTDAVI